MITKDLLTYLADATERFDVIYHEAAITDPRHPDDEEMYRENVEGFRHLLAFAHHTDAKVVYASSASMYGNGPVPMHEEQAKDLLSVYAKSKLTMDEMARVHYGDMHLVGLRYFNVYGPRESHKGRPASMIYHLANQMRQGKRPRLFAHGQQIRDHIYVKDVVAATMLAEQATTNGVYNVGTGKGTSFNELVKSLNRVLGTDFEPVYFDNPFEGTYQDDTQADMERTRTILGFQPQWGIDEGIGDYLEWRKQYE